MTRLLEIAELEAGLLQLEIGLVDIPSLAREAIALAQRQVPEPLRERFTFHLECRDVGGAPTEDVPFVRGDERCLRTVLAHLLDNAARTRQKGAGSGRKGGPGRARSGRRLVQQGAVGLIA